jgi:hypothetical protein
MLIKRPAHETIAEEIRRVDLGGLEFLSRFIVETKIPKGHNEIITAWKERCECIRRHFDLLVSDTLDDLLEQKEKAEAEAAAKVCPMAGPVREFFEEPLPPFLHDET